MIRQTKKLVSFLVLSLGLCLTLITNVSAATFKEGKEFETVSKDIAQTPAIVDFMKTSGTKVTVVEFFSYGCHWCHQFEPYMEAWAKKKPKTVGFVQIPVVFHPTWQILSKAFYAAENLKVSDKVNPLIFKAIHEQNMNVNSADKVEAIFLSAGVVKEEFNKAYQSFGVNRQLETASSLSKAFQITAIPAVIVMGPKGIYKVTSGLTADNMLEVIDYLIAKDGS